MKVEFDHYSLRVEGERRLIRAGTLPYFRLPAAELWRDRLEKMRDAGLNAVDVYYPWNYHSEARDEYDWTGVRDVDRLHDMIEEAGLWLIARPGPYICAEIDLGGLPAWLLRGPATLRCRTTEGFSYSREFLDATEEWLGEIVPRFSARSNLLLVQIENEYTIPTPAAWLSGDLADLLFGWLDVRAVRRLLRPLLRRWRTRVPPDRMRGQTNPYMRELRELVRRLGVEVPIFHNDLSSVTGRQMDVDLLAVDRYSITSFSWDWRDNPNTFRSFGQDEEGLDAHRDSNPLFYPELGAGWYDGWGGGGYERMRRVLGPDSIDAATKEALAERATLWNYFVFCGGTTWGYLSSPDVYSSYDYAAPIGEFGQTGPRYDAVRQLNAFLERFESDLCETDRVEREERWCAEHHRTRRGPARRFEFLANRTRDPRHAATPEGERSTLAPWETQIRVYRADDSLEAVSPESVSADAPPRSAPPLLPRLESWRFSNTSPQLDPGYDDSSWAAVPLDLVPAGEIDIDSLGLHYGFVWYRGTYPGPLSRLLLDARHCWAVWINGELAGAGDQFRNATGVGADGARVCRVDVDRISQGEGRNTIVVLVESLGHNKGFIDDGANPRGIVRMDTGDTPIAWRFRGGLVRGERGITPIVAFDGVERVGTEEVVLPHGWSGNPAGVALYETEFRLEGIDPKRQAIGLAFDPGRGKANLYLNGHLIGRYWPERGPQTLFSLPWGVLDPAGENHLAVTLWKRTPRAALGKLRLEVVAL